MPRDSVNKMPATDYLERKPDGKVYKVTVVRGKYREYVRDNVCLGTVEHIEENRPDLIPQIRGWQEMEKRGVVPIGERLPLKGKGNLAFRISRIKDPAIIRQMMKDDSREAAEAVYIARLDKIAKGILEEDVAEEEELVEA